MALLDDIKKEEELAAEALLDAEAKAREYLAAEADRAAGDAADIRRSAREKAGSMLADAMADGKKRGKELIEARDSADKDALSGAEAKLGAAKNAILERVGV